jgi:hypothetical protein
VPTIRSALVDIEGVLCIGNAPIPGAVSRAKCNS